MTGFWANRWWVVVASACGLMVGQGAILIFTFGTFLKPVSEGLGISRGELSSALGVSTGLTGVGCLVVGWLIDRFGTRGVMMPGILLFALTVAGFGFMQADPIWLIYAIFAVAGLIGTVQTPIPYAAAVSKWFDRERGLALGLATAGVGLGTALIPKLAVALIGAYGWREAYFGLAVAIVVLAFLPVINFVREPVTSDAEESAVARGTAPGVAAGVALRSWRFWALTIAFFLGVMAINGTIVHIVPLLTDRGVPAETATNLMTAAGLAIIFGRVLCGWCLDRFHGPYVAACFFVLPMAGIALLSSGWAMPWPLVGAALCGAGIGAEIDLMAFFISRYFGLKSYGAIYGVSFAIFNLGTGLGPTLSGRGFDYFHSYVPIFMVYEGALAITCLLLVGLGPYAYPALRKLPDRDPLPSPRAQAS